MVMLGWAQVRRQVHKAVMGHHAPNGSYTGMESMGLESHG
jgi:hypothetical protein